MVRVVRTLARERGFAFTTIASVALAVGANTAIFSVANALWLRPLPVSHPETIVVPYYPVVHSSDGELLDSVQLPSAQALDAASAFESVTYELNTASRLGDWRPVLRLAQGAPPISSLAVRSNYFDVLGLRVDGRDFAVSEDEWGSQPVAVVSRAFWRRQIGDSPFSSGASVTAISGHIPIVGIAPDGFHGPRLGDAVDVWITLGALPRISEMASEPSITRLTPVAVFARLRDGITLEAAEAETRSFLHPRTTLRRLRDVAFPLRSEGGLMRQRSLIETLSITAVLVFVLGCANLAALFTARGNARRRDLAIRLSLGSSRGRLVRMVVAEAALLTTAGLAFGLLFRAWLLRGVAALETSAGVPVAALNTSVDWRVIACGVLTAVFAAGLAASGALRVASRTQVAVLISGEMGGGTRRGRLMRQVLLTAHTALAVALLIAASALVSTVVRAFSSRDPFARADLIVASVRPRLVQYMAQPDGDAMRVRDYEEVIAKLEGLASIERVTQGAAPLRPRVAVESAPVRVDGRQLRLPLVRLEGGSGYAAAIGARLVEGRDFTEDDIRQSVDPREMMRYIALRRLPRFREAAPKAGYAAAVIDQTLASLLWPDQPAIGRSFLWTPLEIAYTVVGVTEPLGRHPRASQAIPTMIAPQRLDTTDGIQPLQLVMRATGKDRPLAIVATELRRAFPDAPVLQVHTAADLLAIELSQERMGARIFSYYATAAVLLAVIGVYGLFVFLARQSRQEFAVRCALGASQQSLARLALMRVLTPVLAGSLAGVAIAYALGTAFAARVVGLGAIPFSLALSAAMGFFLLGLLSCIVALRRSGRVTPAELLRQH